MDVAGLVDAMFPYVSAAAGAYGGAVAEKVRAQGTEAAADATVGLGRQLLDRLLKRAPAAPAIEAAVADLGAHADDADFQAAVRAQLKKALAADTELAAELADLLAGSGRVPAGKFAVYLDHTRGAQVGDHNTQHNTFG